MTARLPLMSKRGQDKKMGLLYSLCNSVAELWLMFVLVGRIVEELAVLDKAKHKVEGMLFETA
jgi:hypothetical protein